MGDHVAGLLHNRLAQLRAELARLEVRADEVRRAIAIAEATGPLEPICSCEPGAETRCQALLCPRHGLGEARQ